MPRPNRDMVQTAVRLSRTTLERLKEGGQEASAELRKRLDFTFGLEPIDDETQTLLMMIARMAEDIRLETGAAWHQHPGSWSALRLAIPFHLMRYKPEGLAEFTGEFTGERPHQTRLGNNAFEIGTGAESEVWAQRDWSREQRAAYRAEKERSWQQIVRQRTEGGENV